MVDNTKLLVDLLLSGAADNPHTRTLSVRRLTKDIHSLAQTYENFHYATMPGHGELILHMKDGTRIKVDVGEQR